MKKVKLTRKLQVKFKTAKREMFAKCRKKFFSEIFIRKWSGDSYDSDAVFRFFLPWIFRKFKFINLFNSAGRGKILRWPDFISVLCVHNGLTLRGSSPRGAGEAIRPRKFEKSIFLNIVTNFKIKMMRIISSDYY